MAKKKVEQESSVLEPKGPEADAKPRAKPGRKKNENYLSWEEARSFVRAELIPSRGKYIEWWDRNQPKVVPRFPYRVYTEEWTNWNDFLGNDNTFGERIGTKWRPLNEAVQWVHTLKLENFSKWMEYCRENDLPDDIPARPEMAYDNWKSWHHWLGNKTIELIQAKQEAAKTQVYYIIHEQDVPSNVITFGIEPAGIAGLKARWERDKFDVVKMFWYDPKLAPTIKQIVESLSTEYLGMANQRITPNVHEIVWHISMQLDTVRL
jgi:hypothetical protein